MWGCQYDDNFVKYVPMGSGPSANWVANTQNIGGGVGECGAVMQDGWQSDGLLLERILKESLLEAASDGDEASARL